MAAGEPAVAKTGIVGSVDQAYDVAIMSDLPIHRSMPRNPRAVHERLARLREEWPESQQEQSFVAMLARKRKYCPRDATMAGKWEGATESPCPRRPRLPASVGNNGKPGLGAGLLPFFSVNLTGRVCRAECALALASVICGPILWWLREASRYESRRSP